MENINNQNSGQPLDKGQENKQNNNKHTWKWVWRSALAVIGLALAFCVGTWLYDLMRWYQYESVSANVEIQQRDWPEGMRVYNTKTGKVTVKQISFCYSDDEAPLVRYRSSRKSKGIGYFFRETGEPAIAPEYELGWDVSEGIVAVVDHNKMLHFFTTDGSPLHTKTFRHNEDVDDVKYLGGHCAVCDTTGLWGLIDTLGDWVIQPQYTKIEAEMTCYDEEWRGAWRLKSPTGELIANSDAHIILTCDHDSKIIFDSDETIIVTHKNRPSTVYDIEGKLLYKKAYYTVQQLFFESEEDDEYNSSAQGPAANALKYILWDGRCGLMDLNGHPLTEALYSEIRMLGLNLFSATIYGSSAEVVLDSRGRVVE